MYRNQKSRKIEKSVLFLLQEWILTSGSRSCVWIPGDIHPERCLDENMILANLNTQCCLLRAKTPYQLGFVPTR